MTKIYVDIREAISHLAASLGLQECGLSILPSPGRAENGGQRANGGHKLALRDREIWTECQTGQLPMRSIRTYAGGLPWWLSGRKSTCQCRRQGFHP